jgi:hypothetical protein
VERLHQRSDHRPGSAGYIEEAPLIVMQKTESDDNRLNVTPKMARAGARVLADRYNLLGDEVDGMVATRVFLAMLEASADLTASVEREPEEKAS